jgi:phenylpropionate dioxygenase-like ring-hydroxylating dioxygenase large terminal subunit
MTSTAAPRSQESGLFSQGRKDWSTWPKYEAAVLGFRDYWYPVTWGRKVTKKPIQVTVLGEKIMLIREAGTVRALNDRCPHRGVPLSHPFSSQEFAGTWSCCYHGWTFDLATGVLVAAITDGPDSPICGKVAVRTYPVEERLGLVWIYVGDGAPPPIEADIPAELLKPGVEVQGRVTVRDGNWRFAAENGFDDGHAKYLHRKTLWTLRRLMPAWTRIHIESDDEGWITRKADEVHFETDYPNLGVWPRRPPWRTRGRGGARTSIRLPSMLRVQYAKWAHYEWYVGSLADQHIYIQLVAQQGGPLRRLIFRLYYWLWVRWVFHGMFNDEDKLMVDVMDAPPERLYRPDISLTEWRRKCEVDTRGRPQGPDDPRVAATRRNVGGSPAEEAGVGAG